MGHGWPMADWSPLKMEVGLWDRPWVPLVTLEGSIWFFPLPLPLRSVTGPSPFDHLVKGTIPKGLFLVLFSIYVICFEVSTSSIAFRLHALELTEG